MQQDCGCKWLVLDIIVYIKGCNIDFVNTAHLVKTCVNLYLPILIVKGLHLLPRAPVPKKSSQHICQGGDFTLPSIKAVCVHTVQFK